ncbi:unnamed protein product [Brachionus calyciflorus]|uniref:RNA polymerase II assembly factor Rtp1 C-terminal domain-containing protein n=1 Tax=Brachionus calyciflorus TaxID=104777 RepID=A0A814B6N3_9BILA|nr:unnamed protein product [Brachionus calyciflorus]
MHLNEILNLIRDLLSPASKIDQTNLSKISLNTIIENCLNNFDSKHNSLYNDIRTDDDPLWRFGLIGLRLLKLLNESDFESSPTGAYLSINDERMISQFCQLIVCFTIHYNLEDNIGIPIEKLSRYGVNLTQKRQLLTPQIRNERLYETLCILYEIKNLKREHLNLIPIYFYRKYLHEIICALIQSAHSVHRFKHEEKFTQWLMEDLFEECDGASLVSNLIMAQGTRPNKETIWFTSRIGQLLTKCLLKPNSVMNVIRAVLTEMNAVSTVSVASDWKKCDIVAKILAQCPREIKLNDYFQLLTPQILSLYFCQDIKFSRHFLRVSGSIYSLFSQRYPQMTRDYLTRQILSGFWPILENETLIMSHKQLKEELNKFFLVYIQSTEPNQYALDQIPKKLVFFLFKIYTGLRNRVNCQQINRNLQEFLNVYIKLNSEPVIFINDLLLSVTDVEIKLNLEFFSDDYDDDENSQSIVLEKPNPYEELTLTMTEEHCQSLISLIENLDTVKLNLMIFILRKLTEENKTELVGGQKLLLEIEEGLLRESREINEKIIYFTTLSRLFEIINVELIVQNFEEIINFCHILIENFSKYSSLIEEELIQLVLSIVSVFTSGTIEIEYEVKQKLQILLPGLLNLKNKFSNVEEMIDSLYVSIATYTGIKSDNEKVLIEEIQSDEFSRVLKDVNDPLIPISAHGFVELRKLIEKKDEKCLQNVDKLVELTLKGVKNEDSYLYLAAINAMIALTVYAPKKLLDPLIEQFISEKKLHVDDRLKIGEVLTKTIRTFNELISLYAPKLINAFLIGIKSSDYDEVFQSSCLSNLGEICKLLNYSIQNDIYEILSCLSALLDTHKSLHVKRSAILVLKMIVEGLKKENFLQVLGNSLTPLYKLLIKIKNTTQDDVIRLNCQLTSDYINEMMMSSMFPKQVLQKEIKVLRP